MFTRGHCLYSGFCAAHAPCTRSIWAFSTALTPRSCSVLVASSALLPVLGNTKSTTAVHTLSSAFPRVYWEYEL